MNKRTVNIPDECGQAVPVEYYVAGEVDARIAELEHQLDIRKAAVEAQFQLLERVKEVEKALRAILAFPPGEFRPLADEIKIYEIAKLALGLGEGERLE